MICTALTPDLHILVRFRRSGRSLATTFKQIGDTMHHFYAHCKVGGPNSVPEAGVTGDLFHGTNRSLLANARHRLLVHGALIKSECMIATLQPRDTIKHCMSNNSTAFDFLSNMDMQVHR